MKDIKVIGFYIPFDDEVFIKLDSLNSLSDSDIVIFNPSFDTTDYSTSTSYSSNEMYNGKSCYNHDSSAKIKEHSDHWIKEFTSYLKLGKTLFISLPEKETFYIQTGEKSFSGTGKNRQTINKITDFSNFKYLPNITGLKYDVSHGKNIISKDHIFKNLLDCFGKYLSYKTYLTFDGGFQSTLVTKNKDKIVGGVLQALGGYIVFLPKIDLRDNSNEEDEYSVDEDNVYTQEELKLGKQFIQTIIEIDSILQSYSNKTSRPDWLNGKDYILEQSIVIRNLIDSNKDSIKELNIKIQSLNEDLIKAEKLNDLLFETGKALEDAVIYALNILGYQAENFDNGVLELDQVIISPEGIRFIGECEGKDNKPIDITKFRQLLDSLNEDFERSEITIKAYGILFGNPFRLEEPNKRKDSFTVKCLAGAEREKIALIETKELYRVSKYLLENNDEYFKKRCRETLFNGLGKIIKFPAI